jgi:predicted amidohydrolase
MQPSIGDVVANVAHSINLIAKAASQGAELVVLPELSNSGYVFQSRAEAFELAEPIPSGPTTAAWAAATAEHGLYLVAGICERDGDKLYNSAVVIGPEGYIGTFRKVHLWNAENLYFEPGNLGFPVFHTPIGRIGVAICYDGWFPEAYRLAALQGADIVCVPTNWVPIPGQAEGQQAVDCRLELTHFAGIFPSRTDPCLNLLPRRSGGGHRSDRHGVIERHSALALS